MIVLAFTQFVEPILRCGTAFWEWTAQLGRFLPGAASDALVGSSIFTALGTGRAPSIRSNGGRVDWCSPAYAAVFLVAGALTTWRRDVT